MGDGPCSLGAQSRAALLRLASLTNHFDGVYTQTNAWAVGSSRKNQVKIHGYIHEKLFKGFKIQVLSMKSMVCHQISINDLHIENVPLKDSCNSRKNLYMLHAHPFQVLFMALTVTYGELVNREHLPLNCGPFTTSEEYRVQSVQRASLITARISLSSSWFNYGRGLDLCIPFSCVTQFPGCFSCCKLKKKNTHSHPSTDLGKLCCLQALPSPSLICITAGGQRGGHISQLELMPAGDFCRTCTAGLSRTCPSVSKPQWSPCWGTL